MALGEKLNQLNGNDLDRWRKCSASYELALCAHPEMNLEEAQAAIVAYYAMFQEFREAYMDSADQDEPVAISPIGGDIRLDDGE